MSDNPITIRPPAFSSWAPQQSFIDPDPKRVDNVPLTLTVVLASTTMTLEEIAASDVNHTIIFDQTRDDPVRIYINGHLIAEGEIVVTSENYAVRITRMIEEDV